MVDGAAMAHRMIVILALAVVVGLAGCGGEEATVSRDDVGGPSHPPAQTSRPDPGAALSRPPHAALKPPAERRSLPASRPTTAPTEPARLAPGDKGPRITRLQRRLHELGYWIGTPDGVFGEGTAHAVVALQKAADIAPDGIVGPVTRQALDRGVVPAVRSQTGTVVEVDRSRQLVLLVRNGELAWIFDASTGQPGWTTPAGRFRMQWEIDGYRVSRFGELYRPKYFHRGIALHGAASVPAVPASHGCVRVTNPAMDLLWARAIVPIGTPVWVY